jgi:hypothetical protein
MSRRSPAKIVVSFATLVAALAAANGCQSSAEATGGAACTLGDRIPCSGANGCNGSAACLPDLSDFGECDCGGDASVPDSGPMRDAGARDAGEGRG